MLQLMGCDRGASNNIYPLHSQTIYSKIAIHELDVWKFYCYNDGKEYARRGGRKGGKARAAKMTPERRREIAKKAAAARWSKS